MWMVSSFLILSKINKVDQLSNAYANYDLFSVTEQYHLVYA